MQHIKNSSQHKEFQCPVCLKFFSRKFTLEMHFLIHQGVKPHACPFCGKCFRQKGTLMRHKALHSTTALFHCGLCNRSFRQKNVFLHHLKHRHKVSTENLDRRKWRTQVTDSESLMNTLPPFASADTVAISTSDKNMENILFNTYSTPKLQNEGRSMSISLTSGEEHSINRQRENASKTLSDKNITNVPNFSDCFNRNIPQNGSLWQCNVCNYEIPFDYLTCSAHVSLHEQKLKHKCCLCLKLFSTNSDYHQHMSLYHDNSKLITEEIPSCSKSTVCQSIVASTNSHLSLPTTCNSLKLYHSSNSVSDMTMGSEETSVFLKTIDHTMQPCSSDSYYMQDLGDTPSNKQDMTFTCIPCQMDFTVEEDFECHVKTHVQSILLSDSESLEVDGSKNIENIKGDPSTDKIISNSNNASVMPLQEGDDNGKNFAKYFSSNSEVLKTQKCSNGSTSSITFHQSSTIKTKTCDKNKKKYLDKIPDISQSGEERSCLVRSEGTTHAKVKQDSIKEFHYDQNASESSSSNTTEENITYGMFSSTQKPEFIKHKSSCAKENRKISQLTYSNSHTLSKINKESVHKSDYSLQKLDTARQPCHSNVVYLCAFCRKHLSCAKQLYRHVKLHIQSIDKKFIRKNVTNNNKIIASKPQICKAKYHFKNDSHGKKGLPLSTLSNSIKPCTTSSSNYKGKYPREIIQTNKNIKLSTHKGFDRHKQFATDSNITITGSTTMQKCATPPLQMYSSSRTQYLYKCRKCRKTFSKKSIYHYHMQMHLSVCTFRCFTCHKRFLCKEQLLRHTRINHLRSYQCKVCSRVFQYSVVYKRHSKSCTKVNNFKNLMSATGEISVPIISLQDTSKLKLENLVGIIPVSTKALGTNIPERAMAAIPVISPTAMCQLDSLPIIGSLPLFG